MPDNPERRTALKPIEICFGDVYEYTFNGETTLHVITWLGEKDYCGSQIFKERHGKLYVSPMGLGSATLSDIHRKLDRRLTLEQVIEGMNNCMDGQCISEEIVQILTGYSKQPPRILTE